jgi:hypothetical protein
LAAIMAIHRLLSMDKFVDSSGQGRWFLVLGFHPILSMHIQPVYTVFVRHLNLMNHQHRPPLSKNSSIDSGGWITDRHETEGSWYLVKEGVYQMPIAFAKR